MAVTLDPRARQLLRTLIAQHIRDGEPVGSRTLAKRSGLDVSPATIRNIMSDLEEIGLVAASALRLTTPGSGPLTSPGPAQPRSIAAPKGMPHRRILSTRECIMG